MRKETAKKEIGDVVDIGFVDYLDEQLKRNFGAHVEDVTKFDKRFKHSMGIIADSHVGALVSIGTNEGDITPFVMTNLQQYFAGKKCKTTVRGRMECLHLVTPAGKSYEVCVWPVGRTNGKSNYEIGIYEE